MSDISELDLQNLRHLIGGFDTTRCKMQEYAKEAEDPKVKQFFEKGARSAMEELYQIAREKSYYVPAEKATAEEVAHVRSLFTQGTL